GRAGADAPAPARSSRCPTIAALPPAPEIPPMAPPAAPGRPALWAKVIDQTRCIGCHACPTASKSENEAPLAVTRTYVKYVAAAEFPHARRALQVTRCNQCDDAPGVAAGPTGAMFR